MVKRIHASLPKKATIIRIHVSGDFFNQKYFNAWVSVAKLNPNILFYAYTKSLKYWLDYIDTNKGYLDHSLLPPNLKLTASWDGSNSRLIQHSELKYARVVFSEEEAKKLNLEIDHDDSHAYGGNKSFALMLHGTQPKGSMAAKAKNKLVASGVKHSYGRKTTTSKVQA